MEFKTMLSGNRLSIFNKEREKHPHDKDGNLQVEFTVHMECREWGVKDISVYATRVVGDIEYHMWGDSDNYHTDNLYINSESQSWELTTQNNLEWGDSIYIQDLIIDFDEKTITVQF